MLQFKHNVKFDSKYHSYIVNGVPGKVLGSVSKIKSEVFPVFVGAVECSNVAKALVTRYNAYKIESKMFNLNMGTFLTTINSQCNNEVIKNSNDVFVNIYRNYTNINDTPTCPIDINIYPHFLHYLIDKAPSAEEKYDEILTFIMTYDIYILLGDEEEEEEEKEKIFLPYTGWKEINNELRNITTNIYTLNNEYKFNKKLTYDNHKIVLIKKRMNNDVIITKNNMNEFKKIAETEASTPHEVYFINVTPSELGMLNEEQKHIGNNTYKYYLTSEISVLTTKLLFNHYYLINRLDERNLTQYGYKADFDSDKISQHTMSHIRLAVFIFWKYTAILGTIMHSEIETMINDCILKFKGDIIPKDYFKNSQYKNNESGILLNKFLENAPPGKFYGVEVKTAIFFNGQYIVGTIDCVYEYLDEDNIKKYMIIDWKRTGDIKANTGDKKDQLYFKQNGSMYDFMYNGDTNNGWVCFGKSKEDQYKIQIGLYRDLFIKNCTVKINVDYLMLMTIRPRGENRVIPYWYNIDDIQEDIEKKVDALKAYILLTELERQTIIDKKLLHEGITKEKKEKEKKEFKQPKISQVYL